MTKKRRSEAGISNAQINVERMYVLITNLTSTHTRYKENSVHQEISAQLFRIFEKYSGHSL